MTKYIPTIGIECHVQLKTKTKLFASVGNDARGAEPNTLISHICLGMPGALPYLNEQAIDLACRAAFALNVEPQKFSKFDRKHYFYPDLPKGYQISQLYHPIILGGEVNIKADGKAKTIKITRAHLEEDAGKNTHPDGTSYSLVDLNRAGTPLLEIVSEPEMHTPEEAKAYATELYLLMKYADVTEGDLYHGNMRFDVNVSISDDPKKLGNRTETKNLNSFKSVEKAVEYEIKRQTELLEKGKEIVQETRGWDDAKQKTTTQRSKEDAHDYRYMPDPDIPPLELTNEFIKKAKSEYDLSNYFVIYDKLFDSGVAERDLLTLFNYGPEVVDFALKIAESPTGQRLVQSGKANIFSNIYDWLINIIPTLMKEYSEISKYAKKIEDFVQLSNAYDDGRLSSTQVKQALSAIFTGQSFDVDRFILDNPMISGTDELTNIVNEVLSANAKAVEDIKNGEMKAIGFLVGQVMKHSKGQANPALAQKLIKQQIEDL